jgi:amino acid adenylation domain-containing protein
MHVLSEQEKSQLLVAYNNTTFAYPDDKTLVDLFEEEVKKNPGKVALIFQEKEFTYWEINERSNQLGWYIRSKYAIKPDDLIGIKLERNEWLIIVLLGILKSGAAYVPVDPEYPKKRIDFIIQDSKCKLVIDKEALKIFLSEENKYSSKNLTPVNKPGDLAYVLYTSGTSGKPKGCMLEHKAVINRIAWQWNQFNYHTEDIILQKTNITFDVSAWEIFMTLCRGAKIVLCVKEDMASPVRILSLIEQQKITCLHFVPGMLNVFILSLFKDPDLQKKISSLFTVITSGEALAAETVKQWYEKLSIPIHNLYGPTEASIDVTWYTTSKNDMLVIPIGKPIWNTQIYILDDELNLCPEDIPGEIYIGGIGLARAYLNAPGLTAEKFIANPFKKGERIYKTGDLGKWLHNGNIQFLGRKDEQVKLNGYRIELHEIKYVLEKAAAIEQAECIPILIDGKVKRLVAFVKLGNTIGNESSNEELLKRIIAEELPSYMIPSEIIIVKGFPYTTGFKLDKRKLLNNYLAL